MADLRPRAAQVASCLLAQMMACRPPVDLMEALGFPLPITVIGELLGGPTTERESFSSLVEHDVRRGHPPARNWPDAPGGYLRLSEPYQESAGQARALGWPVIELASHHLAVLTRGVLVEDRLLTSALDSWSFVAAPRLGLTRLPESHQKRPMVYQE